MGWRFPLVRVPQVDDHGCAIACVATVCGVTYHRARAEFFPRRRRFEDDSSLHVTAKQSIEVIRRLGFKAVHTSVVPRKCVSPTIFFFSWTSFHDDSIHAVVWDPFKKKVIDPGSDHEFNLPNSRYFSLWKTRAYSSICVTGMKKR